MSRRLYSFFSLLSSQPITTAAGQSPVFLPAEALVAKPPIPFTPTSVIRGRRTLAEEELKGKLFSPSGKVKKVHTCPAENCNAAFKRSEHLKRHYRSVHMGSKREFGSLLLLPLLERVEASCFRRAKDFR